MVERVHLLFVLSFLIGAAENVCLCWQIEERWWDHAAAEKGKVWTIRKKKGKVREPFSVSSSQANKTIFSVLKKGGKNRNRVPLPGFSFRIEKERKWRSLPYLDLLGQSHIVTANQFRALPPSFSINGRSATTTTSAGYRTSSVWTAADHTVWKVGERRRRKRLHWFNVAIDHDINGQGGPGGGNFFLSNWLFVLYYKWSGLTIALGSALTMQVRWALPPGHAWTVRSDEVTSGGSKTAMILKYHECYCFVLDSQ